MLVLMTVLLSHHVRGQAFYARESFIDRNVRQLEAREPINWDELDDLPPEWDRVESGIDDLLSLSTAYWEPGLGPRAPRRSGGDPHYNYRGRDGFSAREDTEDTFDEVADDASPSSPQLDKIMHRAMKTVNRVLNNIEKDKGEEEHFYSVADRTMVF